MVRLTRMSMPRLLAAALALLLCAVLAVPAAGPTVGPQYARAAASVPCGALAGNLANNVFNIRAVKVSCRKARRVARQWVDECASDEDGSCLVSAGFSCRYRNVGEQGTVRCGRNQRKVTFDTGA